MLSGGCADGVWSVRQQAKHVSDLTTWQERTSCKYPCDSTCKAQFKVGGGVTYVYVCGRLCFCVGGITEPKNCTPFPPPHLTPLPPPAPHLRSCDLCPPIFLFPDMPFSPPTRRIFHPTKSYKNNSQNTQT